MRVLLWINVVENFTGRIGLSGRAIFAANSFTIILLTHIKIR
jgi:hypothetical protein